MENRLSAQEKLKLRYCSKIASHACWLTSMLGLTFWNRQARPSPGRRQRPIRMQIILLVFLYFAGCYWIKYEKLMLTHVDLMVAMTSKMTRLLDDQDKITHNMMNEFSYPSERARDYSRIAAKVFEGAPSLEAFNKLLDSYDAVVTHFDLSRLDSNRSEGFALSTKVFFDHVARVRAAIKSTD